MIHTKLYLYSRFEQDYKGTDYSQNILQGDQKTDDLTDVLDVVNLTLVGLTRAKEFEPSTKFIYEKWYDVYDNDGNPTQILWKSWDIMVTEDIVTQPIISDENYFNHQITFNEASVVAQGRIVDNISTTYMLKDVWLNRTIPINTEQEILKSINNVNPSSTSKVSTAFLWRRIDCARRFNWQFPNWLTGSLAQWNTDPQEVWDLKKYYIGVITDDQDPNYNTQEIVIPIPMLSVDKCVENTNNFVHEGFCSIRVTLTRQDVNTGQIDTLYDNVVINPLDESVSETEGAWNFETFPLAFKGNTPKGMILDYLTFLNNSDLYFRKLVRKYDTTIAQNSARKIRLNIGNGFLKENCKYNLKVVLDAPPITSNDRDNIEFDYATDVISQPFFPLWHTSYLSQYPAYSYVAQDHYALFWGFVNEQARAVPSIVSATLEFVTFDETNGREYFFAEAPPQNAFDLFTKAQLCSQNYEKQQNIPVDVQSSLPFYVSNEDEYLLKNTQVVENFYNQKNLWEIFIDIGKYIHSIPRISFGENDRFLVTFDKLGRTEQFNNEAMPLTIMNSKNIENYVSACSSYVSNMVQLGGVIDEWVAPKSSSEDYLVYNDVAEIIVSKPIIEIVDMKVKCIMPGHYAGITEEPKSMTSGNGYVFEKNVYDLFSLNSNDIINKGMAIYYELGSNKIQGLNYRLPVIIQGTPQNDYTIKKIIMAIYGLSSSTDIKINDFIFNVVYRTKDTVRNNQTRPDLRKYMLNTQFDRVPQHNQFNNQQDILVDSIKFGNNIYGKLIRTGNTEFTVTEWVQNLEQLKQIGQLYNLRGNIYYVAKVDNTYFSDHVTSVVTYSKDYNQLSAIIGIPSEPRFYEISEQSLINREFCVDDYLILTTEEDFDNVGRNFILNNGLSYLKDLLFGNQPSFPKYAVTTYKNDNNRNYGKVAGNEYFFNEVCSIVNTYSIQNTLTMEWDMKDNFSAGDQVNQVGLSPDGTNDKAYNTLTPVRYPDVYGRADLLDFFLFDDINMTDEDITLLPYSPLSSQSVVFDIQEFLTEPTSQELRDIVYNELNREPKDGDVLYIAINHDTTLWDIFKYRYLGGGSWQPYYLLEDIEKEDDAFPNSVYALMQKPLRDYASNLLFSNETLSTMGDNQHGLILMKDNRETISINYNIQMLTDSDRFVLSSWLWQPNKQNLKVMCLNTEISKISNDTIPMDYVIEGKTQNLTTIIQPFGNAIKIPISTIFENVDLNGVKAIAIASDIPSQYGQYQFVCGRNLTNAGDNKTDWYIYGISKQFFESQ